MAILSLVTILLAPLGCGSDSDKPASTGTATSKPASVEPKSGGGLQKYGPAAGSDYKPKVGRPGGQMVMATFGGGLKSFNPITAGETSSTDYTGRIFDSLLTTDLWTREPKPWIAESWE